MDFKVDNKILIFLLNNKAKKKSKAMQCRYSYRGRDGIKFTQWFTPINEDKETYKQIDKKTKTQREFRDD